MQVIIVTSYYFLTASDYQVMSEMFHLSSWFSSWTHLKVHSMHLFQQPQNITVVILYTGKTLGQKCLSQLIQAALYSPSQVQPDLLKASRRPSTGCWRKKQTPQDRRHQQIRSWTCACHAATGSVCMWLASNFLHVANHILVHCLSDAEVTMTDWL